MVCFDLGLYKRVPSGKYEMVNVEKRLKFSQEKPIAPMSILIMFIGYTFPNKFLQVK
jgi:hypothetical protein